METLFLEKKSHQINQDPSLESRGAASALLNHWHHLGFETCSEGNHCCLPVLFRLVVRYFFSGHAQRSLEDPPGKGASPAKSLLKLQHDFLSAELETEFQQIFLQADDAKKTWQTTLVPSKTTDKWGVAVAQFIQDTELLQANC